MSSVKACRSYKGQDDAAVGKSREICSGRVGERKGINGLVEYLK